MFLSNLHYILLIYCPFLLDSAFHDMDKNNIRRPFDMTSVCVIRIKELTDVIGLLLVDVIDNPLTDFLGAVFCTTFNLNFGSADVLSK